MICIKILLITQYEGNKVKAKHTDIQQLLLLSVKCQKEIEFLRARRKERRTLFE
jgi:hypothetical protein